uniref:Mos1 transposase HTH domain-containing protein n=3 Tax=Rhodnius prolixus TaxID=13249 RepID=T1HQP8_RHOPR
MDEKEFRVLIKHYFMKGKTPQETKEKLDKLFVPQYEEMAGGKKILFKRGGDCRNEWLFFRLGQILLFGRDQQTRAALDEVYKPKRRLC